MSQPPTGPHDPYQFDPYRPGGSDPAQQNEHTPPAEPQGAPVPPPYGAPDPAYAAAPEQQQAPAGWGAPPADPSQAPYAAPGQQPYGQPYSDPQQGYGQPYADPQQGYGQAYADPQQGYAPPYGADPTQQPAYGAPYGGYPAYGAPGPSTTNTLAIVGFILAILGFLGSWIPGVNFFCAVLGLAGIVLGVLGLAQLKKGKTGKGFSITAIILGALSIVVTVLVWVALLVWADNTSSQYEQALTELEQDSSEWEEEADRMSGESTDDILANDLGVEFGAFDGTEDEYGWVESALPVTLTNTSDEALTFDIDVDAVAADGSVIEADWAYSETLEPGASETVEIFTFIDAENLEAMKTATFEVTQASAY